MSLQAEFERVADDVKKVKSRPSDQELLDMYGLYKQAIFGDINIDKPGMLDMKGKAKWEAWDYRKGRQDGAMKDRQHGCSGEGFKTVTVDWPDSNCTTEER
ncbi:acyl-CoA-binding domain-containing protein 7-like isoform X2 [Salvelinus sp. IW2-2015]|uniref:acyl-CoA-binding domain-containing protein 7-like isoform X2 n=1 Tax=Salvelinus sp. IW2-2015 TaxID=2691554 RepID=UPI000CEAB7FE|nr:acyl-CoA-binding domain-containing protein 7-like isoform X2 [Salvelinus alpinus]